MTRRRLFASHRFGWQLVRSTLLVPLAGCALGTDPPPVRVVSADLVAPAPLVRTLRLALEQPAAVTVEYWADGVPRLRVRGPVAAEHLLLLAQLRPGRTYNYEVLGTATAGTFVTGALPEDLARVTFAVTGQLSVPLLMLHLDDPGGFRGYAAVDGAGQVVWYWRTTDFPFGMTWRANGNLVLLDKGRGLVEITPAGQVVHEFAQDVANRELHHDVIATPQNTLLVIAFDDRVVNGTQVRGDAIWEWTPETGAASKRWTAWDHFSPAQDRGPRFGGEWMHANALAIGPRGNVLMSVHYWNQIMSITPDWQRIEWRLGGVNATVTVPDADRFSGQHTPHEMAGGRVLLFDNGVERQGYSRALELAIDGTTARTLWEWRAQPANYAGALGSARRLGNGNTLVAFGMSAGVAGSSGPLEVYEVSSDGIPRWHLIVRNTSFMYRAEPFSAIAGEELAR
jgi:arylsulfotransferase ASST